jgi:hypothetical protein
MRRPVNSELDLQHALVAAVHTIDTDRLDIRWPLLYAFDDPLDIGHRRTADPQQVLHLVGDGADPSVRERLSVGQWLVGVLNDVVARGFGPFRLYRLCQREQRRLVEEGRPPRNRQRRECVPALEEDL